MISSLPNILSWTRVGLIPVLVGCYQIPKWGGLISAGVFLLAAITDLLDGIFARRFKATSEFGAFFDPVADKLIVVTVILILIADDELNLPEWSVLLVGGAIILREVAVSALREWSARNGDTKSTQVSFVGKIKTATQMVALLLLLASRSLADWQLEYVGIGLLTMSAIFGLISMASYVRSSLGSAKR